MQVLCWRCTTGGSLQEVLGRRSASKWLARKGLRCGALASLPCLVPFNAHGTMNGYLFGTEYGFRPAWGFVHVRGWLLVHTHRV